MAHKTIKEEIKKPDIVQSTFANLLTWARENRSAAIAAAVIIVVLIACVIGYRAFTASQNDLVQADLSKGMDVYEKYLSTGKNEDLTASEKAFTSAAKRGSDGPRDIANLYLARISAIKGNTQRAQDIYKTIIKSPANDTVKQLAETGIKDLQKK